MENAREDGVESSSSDAAQQLSACACVMTRSALEPRSADSCIGHVSLSEQQAIRVSGVVCQPAHSAHPAGPMVKATTSAAARLNGSSTLVGCLTGGKGVNVEGLPAEIEGHREVFSAAQRSFLSRRFFRARRSFRSF